MKPHDSDLMSFADGELDERAAREIEDLLARDPDARSKVEAVGEIGEIVRGHMELTADAVPSKKFEAMWREIDKGIERDTVKAPDAAPATPGFWRRVGRFFDHHRGHFITGAVSAGAVAALALILRGPSEDPGVATKGNGPIEPTMVNRPAEIESLDTPDGTGTVFNLEDEDGSTTVIWVTPEDTVEGI